MTPIKRTATPNAMAFKFNCGISNPEDTNPTRGISGSFPMVRGVLNPLLRLGFRYLRTMADRLTEAKMMNVPKLVTSATNSIFPSRTKRLDVTMVTKIAAHGVPRVETFARLLGSEPSFAIPKIIREFTINRISTVLDVAKSAITDIAKNALCPRLLDAANASGEDDAPSSCQSTRLTTAIATSTS